MGWAASLRELGPLGLASYAAARACDRFPGTAWHRYRLVAIAVAAMPAMPRGFQAAILDESIVNRLAKDLDLPHQAIRHRFSQGMTCLGIWRGDHIAGVNWIMAGPFEEDEVRVRFVPPPGCAWDTGLYVHPQDRGGRAFQALWAATADWLRERGLDWTMSRITDHNLASWRAHRRMGARSLGTFAALTLGRTQWSLGAGGLVRTGTEDESPTLLLKHPDAA